MRVENQTKTRDWENLIHAQKPQLKNAVQEFHLSFAQWYIARQDIELKLAGLSPVTAELTAPVTAELAAAAEEVKKCPNAKRKGTRPTGGCQEGHIGRFPGKFCVKVIGESSKP